MEFLSCLLPRFLRRQKDMGKCGNPKKLLTSPIPAIEKLPVEILQLIAGFLAPDSAACFAFCSKSLQWAIGNQSWFTLRTKKKARLRFLVVLQKDLREWLLCYHCEKLYFFNFKSDSNTPWLWRNEHPCTNADGFLYFLPGFGLRFQYAQMIMKLYQSGAIECISLDSLFHAKSYKDGDHVLQRHVSGRIANDNLLVKLEWRILLHRNDDFKRTSTLCQRVCPHWKDILNYDHLAKRVYCQMNHESDQFCPECTGLVQCQFCSTEFIVVCLDSNWSPGGQAIYITVWKNLGSCETPFDSRWRNLLSCIDSSVFTSTGWAFFVPGSIRSAFEDHADFKIGVDGLSTKWPLDSDVEFLRLSELANRWLIQPSNELAVMRLGGATV